MTTDEAATRCLDVADLAKVIDHVGLDAYTDELIDRLRAAIEVFDPERIHHRTRSGFSYRNPNLGLVEWMPAMAVGEFVSVKTVGYHPDNPTARNLPSVLATIALYETATGRLSAICEGTLLTALRTGAASAVMTDALIRPGPIALGIIGCGAQAVTQIHAISRVRPIDRLVVTDVAETNALSLSDRLPDSALKTDLEIVDPQAFTDVVPDLDVLCTCTSVGVDRGPVVELRGAKPGLHVNAVGSDFPGKIELPVEYLRSSIVVPDVTEQCLLEGEAQQLTEEELGPDMVQVLADPASAELVNQRTVFDSTGWSYEDQVAAMMFLEHASRLGVGSTVALQHAPRDPFDPFEMLRD